MKIKRIDSEKNLPTFRASDELKSQKQTPQPDNQRITAYQKQNKIQQQLEDKVKKSVATELFDVIVHLNCDVQKDLKRLDKILGNSFKPKKVFKYINAFLAELTPAQIRKLNTQQDVKFIEENIEIHINLDTANKWFSTERAREDFQLSGRGITIAIVDTGVDNEHMDLSGNKVVGWSDFVNGVESPYDDQGHGTHVASIAAGTGDGNYRYHGVAPEASIVGVKVLDRTGSGSMSQIIEGIEWLIDNKDTYNIHIANLSLGSVGSSDGLDALSQVCNVAVDHGIIVVVSAGNSGPNRYTIGTPAAAEKAITVGSMADVGERGFFLNLYSSRGPTADERIKPDIIAPGHRITAARANSRSDYITFSGTSMASPYVAGTVALMLEADRELTNNQIKGILFESSQDWGGPDKDIDYGYGRLQGYQAVMTAADVRGDIPETPTHISQNGSLQNRSQDIWQYAVNNLSYPVSITMIQENERIDFDLYIYDSNGNIIGYSNSTDRQETVSFVPRRTGNYFIEVYSFHGSGHYFLDVSGG
ncbi:serine protease AprX [Evansella vedderi]|uniref:Serine protease AprX n=1 Tax=Evansella vedderi TaxID=38282 RepID=A0ABT9ZQQ8_9BACI|nr:S8 family serine peptidase [Evansella vedderi]MDQ0253534.1 serine protease AprX [Evansella vedderi]